MNVSSLFVRGVLSELRNRKLEGRSALLGTDIDEVRLGDLSSSLSIATWEHVVAEAKTLAPDPLFAFQAGAHLPLSALHWLGFLLRGSRCLRESIKLFERYACLLADPLCWELREDGSEAKFICRSALLREEAARFSVEFALALALQVGDHLMPGCGGQGAVHLDFAFPGEDTNTRNGCRVRFARRENAIVFPAKWLDEPRSEVLEGAMIEPFREHAESLLLSHAQRGLIERVRALLAHQSDLSQFEAQHLASMLNMTERMLRRRLAEEGMPLAELLGEVRRSVALREMQRNNVAIKALSEQLGFSEPSAFHRAFKRWTGKTPSEFLRRQKLGLDPMASEEAEDALVESSGIFQMQKVPKAHELLHDRA